MSQIQLYWIIGAVVVLIALGILFALMSRRHPEDEGAARRDAASGHAGLAADSGRAPMIGNADVRTPDVAGAADREAAPTLPAFDEPAAAGAVKPAPALAAFNVADADRTAQQKKDAGRPADAAAGHGSTAAPAAAPAAGLSLRKATAEPQAGLGDAGLSLRKPAQEAERELAVDPLETALAAAPETEMTAAEIAAEAAAQAQPAPEAEAAPKAETAPAPGTAAQAETAPALGLAAAGVAGGTGVVVDEKDGGVELPAPVASTPADRVAAAAPATQAMPVVESERPTPVAQDSAGVAGGAGVTVDEAEQADAPAAPAAPQAPAAPASKVGTPTLIGTSMSQPTTPIPSVNEPKKPAPAADATPAVPVADATPAAPAPREEQVPQDVRIDGTPGLPGRIAMGEPAKDEAVAVTPHGDSRDAVQARRDAGVAAPGLLGKVAGTVKDKAAPLVERAQPVAQKAAPLAEKAKDAALPLVEKAKETATPLLGKAVSALKDKLSQAQSRRWGRN